jgi:hypothetical protein
MTVAPNRYALRPVRSPQEWATYHAIRRQIIFAALVPGRAYDEHDRDEIAPGNVPHVLLRDGEIVGVVRIDLIGQSRAGLRLVGIRSDLQRQGKAASCSGLRRTPRAFSAKRRSPSTPTDLAGLLPRQWLWPRRMGPDRCRQPSFAWEKRLP